MESKHKTDREHSTEQLFSLEEKQAQELEEAQEQLGATGGSDEELFLQNIFYDKGEDAQDDRLLYSQPEQEDSAAREAKNDDASQDTERTSELQGIFRAATGEASSSVQNSNSNLADSGAQLDSSTLTAAGERSHAFRGGSVSQSDPTLVDSASTAGNADSDISADSNSINTNAIPDGDTDTVSYSESTGSITIDGEETPDSQVNTNPSSEAESTPIEASESAASPQPAAEISQASAVEAPVSIEAPISNVSNVSNEPENAQVEAIRTTGPVAGDNSNDSSDPGSAKEVPSFVLTGTVGDVIVEEAAGSDSLNAGTGNDTESAAAPVPSEPVSSEPTPSEPTPSEPSEPETTGEEGGNPEEVNPPVTPVNNDPTVGNVDLGATTQETAIVFSGESLLANASDLDGDNLQVTKVSVQSEYGIVTENGDDTWTFQPAAEFYGDDISLEFSVSDGTSIIGASAILDVTPATAERLSLIGTENADTLVGSETNDHIEGKGGNDSLYGGEGDNVLDGGEGNDRLYAHKGGTDHVSGGAGDDLLYIDGNDTVDGGEGNDRVYTYGEDDVSLDIGASSIESVQAQSNADHEIDASTADAGVRVSLRGGDDEVTGSDHNDSINTGWGDNTVDAGAGNDSITTGGGNDVISGGAGNDSINAGAGDNTIDGGDGSDRIYAHKGGTDDISGGAGDDLLYIDGNDTVDGGEGNDRVYTYGEDDVSLDIGASSIESVQAQSNADHEIDASTAEAGVRVSLRGGDDEVTGSDHNDSINAGTGDNVIDGGAGNDSITTSDGDDVISGGSGNDTLKAGTGNDTIDGGAGSDRIYGGDGADTISGGLGNDTMDGGQGNDTLVLQGFRFEYEVTQNSDSQYTITDTVEDRDGSDKVSNFEQFQFADVTLDTEEILLPATEPAPTVSGEELLQTMEASAGLESEMGWAESVQVDDSSFSTTTESGWDSGTDSSATETDLAASAMDLTPDTSSVVTMTESANAGVEGTENLDG
ncbi:MAG: cadherin-like domain-containing protein [Halioglobus sp.]